jgi:hypothetical protein
MKRSEMIRLIAEDVYFNTNIAQEDCKGYAERLLTKIEQAGMLPPEWFHEEWCTDVNQWEPELEGE